MVAIIISIISVCIACLSLGWNIYRDVILKARVRVNFSIMTSTHNSSQEYLTIHITNYGPGVVNITQIIGKKSTIWKILTRNVEYGIIIPDNTLEFNTRLPVKMEVSDNSKLFLRYNQTCFLSQDLTQVGITDSYGRCHWAPRKSLETAMKRFKKDFDDLTIT